MVSKHFLVLRGKDHIYVNFVFMFYHVITVGRKAKGRGI